MGKKDRGAYVTWADYMGRSQGFIDNMNLIPIYIKKSTFAPKVVLPLRYMMNSIETLFRLFIEKPAYIIVMSPPIFAVISVYLYVILTGTNFIVDNHSGSFESRKWRWSIPILRFICRKADLVLVTNFVHFEAVKSWKSKPMIVGDPPPAIPHFARGYSCKLSITSPSIVVVNSYTKNEALDEIIDAAKLCKDVIFYVTGDKRKVGKEILNGLPANVILTGWLEDNEFWWLLRKCNAILTLIIQENTILRGGWEAMYLGQPLITSNTIANRNYFYKGAVFVDNRGKNISDGICYALKNEMELKVKMEELRLERIHEWNENKIIILQIISPKPL